MYRMNKRIEFTNDVLYHKHYNFYTGDFMSFISSIFTSTKNKNNVTNSNNVKPKKTNKKVCAVVYYNDKTYESFTAIVDTKTSNVKVFEYLVKWWHSNKPKYTFYYDKGVLLLNRNNITKIRIYSDDELFEKDGNN